MENHKIVSREEGLVARKKHLAKEKEFTHLRDQLSQQRRELPWVKTERRPYQSFLKEGANCLSIISCSIPNSLQLRSRAGHVDWRLPPAGPGPEGA